MKSGASVGRAAMSGAVAGAIIGGAVSAAKQMKDVKEGKLTKEKAIENTVKDATGTGLATAAGMAVASGLGMGLVMSIVAMTAASAGVKYLWDSSIKTAK